MSRVCVFCGSKKGKRSHYAEEAARLGRRLAGRGLRPGLRRWSDGADGRGGRFDSGGGRAGHRRDSTIHGHQGGGSSGTDPPARRRDHARTEGVDGGVVRRLRCASGRIRNFRGTAGDGHLGSARHSPQAGGPAQCRRYFDPLLEMFDRAVQEGFVGSKYRSLCRVAAGVDELLSKLESGRGEICRAR